MDISNKETKLTRKELERLRRRADILHAARELFLTKGYRDASLEVVAQMAEFSKGTIYNYFANKEELLWGMIEQFLEDSVKVAKHEFGQADRTASEKFQAYANVVIATGREHEFFHALMKEGHVLEASGSKERLQILSGKIRDIWGIIALEIENEMSAGRFKQGNALQLASLFDLMVRTFGVGTQRKDFPIPSQSPEEVVQMIVSTFLNGIAIHNEGK